MEVLEPLFEKFAAEASAVNVVLLLVIIFMGFIFYLRERERRDLVKQLISLGFESAKSALSTANAIDIGNKEAREERIAIQTLLNLGHKVHRALEELKEQLRKK